MPSFSKAALDEEIRDSAPKSRKVSKGWGGGYMYMVGHVDEVKDGEEVHEVRDGEEIIIMCATSHFVYQYKSGDKAATSVKKVKLDCVPEQPPRRSKRIQEQAASTKTTQSYLKVTSVKKVKLDSIPEQPPRRSKRIQEQAASTKTTQSGRVK